MTKADRSAGKEADGSEETDTGGTDRLPHPDRMRQTAADSRILEVFFIEGLLYATGRTCRPGCRCAQIKYSGTGTYTQIKHL